MDFVETRSTISAVSPLLLVIVIIGLVMYLMNQSAYKKLKLLRKYSYQDYQNRVLLVGSAFMECWKSSEESLSALDTLNVGIAGTKVADWKKLYLDLIVPYHPEAIVIDIGSNDIDEGKTGEAVSAELGVLFRNISIELPDTPIFYLSITPASLHENVWYEACNCNQLMAEYCDQSEDYHFVACTEVWTSDVQSSLYDFFGVECDDFYWEM